MSNGFIKLPRSLLTDPVWGKFSSDEKIIFITLLTNMAWKETVLDDFGVLTVVKPGQVLMTQRDLVRNSFPEKNDPKALSKYKSLVNRALAKFKKLKFSNHKTNHKKTIHTIVREDICELFEPNFEPNSNQTRTTKEEYKNIRKNKYTPNSVEFELASFFIQEIQRFLPDFNCRNIQTWCKHLHSLLSIDKRLPEDVKDYISWITSQGNWWQGKILSPEKLRKHWDTLTAQIKQKKNDAKAKESKYEKISRHFTHGNLYNAAECTLDERVISFTRGMKHIELKFSEYGFEDQFDKMLREFGISNPFKAEKKIEFIEQIL